MKYLKIREYSTLIPHKIPEKMEYENELKLSNSIIRSYIEDDYNRVRVSEDYNPYINSVYNDALLEDKTIALNDCFIYDDIDVNEDQEIAYVMECPICLTTTIASKKLDFCPYCENNTFPPIITALINTKQMEDVAIDNPDISELAIIKDNKIIFKDQKDDMEVS